jgi:hypothetical protein
MSDISFVYGGLTVNVSSDDILSDNCDYKYSAFYQKDVLSDLSMLCDKYGSDKGEIKTEGHPYPWPSHNYADFYEAKFDHCRDHFRRVFECGLGTNNPAIPSTMGSAGKPGASLRIWRDYFPNAHIFGADIDRDILFQEERISTFYVDQTSPESIRELWRDIQVTEFDLIIDDGLHDFEAGVCLFENSFAMLRKSGIYIIEDVWIPSMISFRNYFKSRDHKVEFVNLHRPGKPLMDNALIVVRK